MHIVLSSSRPSSKALFCNRPDTGKPPWQWDPRSNGISSGHGAGNPADKYKTAADVHARPFTDSLRSNGSGKSRDGRQPSGSELAGSSRLMLTNDSFFYVSAVVHVD